MRIILSIFAVVVALTVTLWAQATNITTSGTLPANCTVGNVYVKTGGSDGMYVCLATDTWSQLSAATTIPFVYNFVVGTCQNTTPSLGLSLPTSNPAVVACVTGTNTQLAVAQFADSANLSMQGHFSLPSDFTGALDLDGSWRTSATSGDVVWQIATICVADAETIDPAFNAASTVTETAKGTTLQLNNFSISSVTATGCAASEELFFKFFRDAGHGSDTLAATAELVALRWTVRRTV